MTLRKEIRSLFGARFRLLTPMPLLVLLMGLLSAPAYTQSGPPADSCDANPVTCAPQITVDECASSQTLHDMYISARADGSWDPDYIPGVETKQLLFPSGSGYYGYRPCKGFVVDLVVYPRSYNSSPDAHDGIAWNAGAWDLPSSSQNEAEFPALVRGVNNLPEVGYGDANLQDLPSGSTSVPTNADDCNRYTELVRIYSATFSNLLLPKLFPLHWTQTYYRQQAGSWLFNPVGGGGSCSLQCVSSFPESSCAPPTSISFPDADQNEPAIAYRFVIGTLLRTSWQQTGLVLWEQPAQIP